MTTDPGGSGAVGRADEGRTKDGTTVGLIDALITLVRVLKTRDLSNPSVHEALRDLRADPDVSLVMGGNEINRLSERIHGWSGERMSDEQLAEARQFLELLQAKETAWSALHKADIAMLRDDRRANK
jgi:hypothetical protein